MSPPAEHATNVTREVTVQTEHADLPGLLTLPIDAAAVVLFAHGSGSSRFSPRNRHVAAVLNQAGLGTLLFDLLTEKEHSIDQYTRHLRFDIGLLADRLVGALDWSQKQASTAGLAVGLFGASTGAAAALVAAADRPALIRAAVARGGRPDLAGTRLKHVHAPTLLIVGERDAPVIDLNRDAAQSLSAKHRIEIVPGATHLFEEAGTLDRAAALARDWFVQYLRA